MLSSWHIYAIYKNGGVYNIKEKLKCVSILYGDQR